MASIVPSELSTGLNAVQAGIGDVFTNVNDVVQTVNSVYDQLLGKSQNVPAQSAELQPQPAPAPTATQAAATTTTPAPSGMPSGTTLAIGAAVLIGVLLVLRK